jgi:rod shape-determining protein MreC
MLEVPFRHRPLLLLTVVLLIQILLLAFQIRRGENARLIRIWAVEIVTPWQRAGTWVGSTLHSSWKDYVDLHHVRVENQQLRNQITQLAIRNQQLESQAHEQERLERLLNFREAYPSVNMLAAEVIGANADASSRTLYINRGQRDGLTRDMGVITPEGVVGKILEVFSGTAQVLLINDKESGVGAMLASSRTHGVVKGLGQMQLRMDYVPNDEKMSNGDAVVTSGDDQIFPKDLPIGTVTGAGGGNPFKTILIQPAVRLDRLEEVLVLLSRDELAPQTQGRDSETAGAPTSNAPAPAGGAPQ